MPTALEIYDEMEFLTNSLFNERAPAPSVSFAIGGILSAMGFILWNFRLNKLRKQIESMGLAFDGSLLVRAMISAMVDEDDRFYAIVSFSAISFLILGGLQLNYVSTLLGMFGYYFFKASLEAFRTLLGFWSANDLSDVVITSKRLKSEFHISTEIQPLNIYGDLSAGTTMTAMVFVTQLILIYLTIASLFTEDAHLVYCWDWTDYCPVAGTLGSWSLYILGILSAMVYKLGPQTSFGHSPQNPAFWLQLFLAGKHKDSTFTWTDPISNETKTSKLYMYKVWLRYIMSFTINGVGFHLLLHSLPVEVARTNAFYDIVWAVYGMMWLVDMDYLWGNALTISHPVEKEEGKTDEIKADKAPAEGTTKISKADAKTVEIVDTDDTVRVSAEALKIINEARAKLDALAKGEKSVTTVRGNANHNLAAGALLHVQGASWEDENKVPTSSGGDIKSVSTTDVFSC
mmetsp:Transcript_79/g.107  ORF Transcript_79/g.107 Transcript_79/m.107 type:complete len:459 (+) Transcript_79:77-1453(+)